MSTKQIVGRILGVFVGLILIGGAVCAWKFTGADGFVMSLLGVVGAVITGDSVHKLAE